MTPKFAQAVDPIFLHVLDLHERNERGEASEAREEHLRINALLDQAEAILGAGPDWELAKYAIVSWIDELLVDTPWSGRDWWSNNVLEVQHFNTRLCNEQFFVKAQEASTLTKRDALEVYYICVVMGFQGLYRDPSMADALIHGHGLAPDLASWAQQASMSIRLGQGRPPLKPPQREIGGAPPLRSTSLVVWSWLVAVVLLVSNVVYFYFQSSFA